MRSAYGRSRLRFFRAEKERKKREKEEYKFRTSGKKIFERSELMSKFKEKYQERVQKIRQEEEELREQAEKKKGK